MNKLGELNGVEIFHTKDREAQIIFLTKENYYILSSLLGSNTPSKFDPVTICPFFKDEDFQEVWKEWQRTPRMQKVSKSERALKMRLNKLMKACCGNKDFAIELTAYAADKGYQEIYDIPDRNRRGTADVTVCGGNTNKAIYDRQTPDDIKREMGLN